MEFVFSLTRYDKASFLAQVSKALEQRTQLESRKQNPKLWACTDRLNGMEKAPEAVLEKRRRQRWLFGILLLALGLFLFIPGVMNPKHLPVPLAGGTLAIFFAIATLLRGRGTEKPTAFDQAAARLFQAYETSSGGEVRVTEDAILRTESSCVDYADVEQVLITEEFLVFIWKEQIVVLQQKDLTSHSVEELLQFLTEKAQGLFELVRLT